MLFLPLLDRTWRIPALPRTGRHYLAWACVTTAMAAIIIWHPASLPFAISTLFTAALPEEWFFRAYFMDRLGKNWESNAVASILFALLHGLTHNWATAMLVLAPSLFYGWLYQRTRNLPLLVLTHALSNLIFTLFLAQFFADFM